MLTQHESLLSDQAEQGQASHWVFHTTEMHKPFPTDLCIGMTVSASSSSISLFRGISGGEQIIDSACLFSLYVAAAFTVNYQPMWRHESPAYVASEPSSSSMRSN